MFHSKCAVTQELGTCTNLKRPPLREGPKYNYIVTCQVHPVLVKRVQCTVRSFLNF